MSKQLNIGKVTLTKVEASEAITNLTAKIKSEVLPNTIGHAVTPNYLITAGIVADQADIAAALAGADLKPEEVTGYTVYEGAFYVVTPAKAEKKSGSSTTRSAW